jgi:hypothetical protein
MEDLAGSGISTAIAAARRQLSSPHGYWERYNLIAKQKYNIDFLHNRYLKK